MRRRPKLLALNSTWNAIGWLYRNVFLSSSDLWRFSWVYAAASLIFQFRRVHDGDFVSTTKDNRDRGVFFAWSVSLQSFYIEERIGTWLHLGREASINVMGAFTPVSIDGRFHKSYGRPRIYATFAFIGRVYLLVQFYGYLLRLRFDMFRSPDRMVWRSKWESKTLIISRNDHCVKYLQKWQKGFDHTLSSLVKVQVLLWTFHDVTI